MNSDRARLFARLFPGGVPPLWCPMITHYRAGAGLDRARQAAHLRHLAPCVKGLLIPGSTGDGWEMDESEIRELLDFILGETAPLGLRVLIGVLKTDADEARRCILETVSWLQSRAGTSDVDEALAQSGVCGFTVCPPKGAELSQPQIHGALAGILALGLPTALYQLPQVTQNEMAPDTVAALAARFPNFILFKDTSGADRVAQSGAPLDGVFLLRGAEASYAKWPRAAGGPYDGFLLSTANCFGRALLSVIEDVKAGHASEAGTTSSKLTAVVNEVFRIVTGLPQGNAFANANKAMDHFFAHGNRTAQAPSPRLHGGSVLPPAVLDATRDVLMQHGLLPESGYLSDGD